jgi:hypothetical protein
MKDMNAATLDPPPKSETAGGLRPAWRPSTYAKSIVDRGRAKDSTDAGKQSTLLIFADTG